MLAARIAWRPIAVVALICSAGFAGVVACSSFGDDTPSVDAMEAGATTEGGADPDGGVSVTDASGPAFCDASDATVCVDFDDGLITQHWSDVSKDPATVVAIDPTISRSGKYSLKVSVDAEDPKFRSCSYARVVRTLEDLGKKTNASLAFDVQLGALRDVEGTNVLRGIAAMVFNPSVTKQCAFIVAIKDQGCNTRLESPAADGGLTVDGDYKQFDLPLGQKWVHVEATASLVPGGTMTFLVDGVPCGRPVDVPAACAVPSTVDIYPGLYCVQTDGGYASANIDNVELRASP